KTHPPAPGGRRGIIVYADQRPGITSTAAASYQPRIQTRCSEGSRRLSASLRRGRLACGDQPPTNSTAAHLPAAARRLTAIDRAACAKPPPPSEDAPPLGASCTWTWFTSPAALAEIGERDQPWEAVNRGLSHDEPGPATLKCLAGTVGAAFAK